MRIAAISCLQDNYAYLLICEKTETCAVVDPSEGGPVLAEIEKQGLTVAAIWNTHHHYDHVGGNEAVLAKFPDAVVVAHESDKGRVPGQTVFAKQGDEVTVGEEVKASIILWMSRSRRRFLLPSLMKPFDASIMNSGRSARDSDLSRTIIEAGIPVP